MDINNRYTKMQKNFYDSNAPKMAKTDHIEHNSNKDYWNILLGDLDKKGNNGIGLDFGSGTGRNVRNLLENWKWNRFDGIDISKQNINEANKLFKENGFNDNSYKFYFNNGVDLSELKSDEYNFVMSTIVFQHISVYEIRYALLEEIYRVLKSDGLFSFQMGFNSNPKYKTVTYYENYYDAKSTNSDCNVRVDYEDDIKKDLEKIGFIDVEITIRNSYSDDVHPKWIYIKAKK